MPSQDRSVAVRIPSALRIYSDGALELKISATSVRAALEQLKTDYFELYRSVCDETGRVRPHINLFVNETHIRDLDDFDSRLSSGDVFSIWPAVSGG